ncbi:MAG TPA: trigger factor [Candidatus Acidoferrales bacterium]|jgi:trigger factor|nr:trigger factor [Candidatus Acidoferrales bacterium]
MTETTCKREIELEIPAENVTKATEKVARDLARVARIPGFRPGKAPVTLIRRRFAGDIQGEVLQSLVPEYLEKALDEKKLVPVTRPEVDKVEFKEGEPLKFRAVFEVLPEFELGNYKGLEIQVDAVEAGQAQVDKVVEEMRERAATFVPVEGRAAKDGDFALIKLSGLPEGGGDPVEADNIMCHIGAEETLESFTENLRGANPGETKKFQSKYPDDYPDQKLAGKTYDYSVEVLAIKEKKLPEVNDEFAKDAAGEASGVTTVAELRKKILENLEAAKEEQQSSQAREKILEALVKKHDFPVPEALVEHQMDVRLERTVRSLTAQGVDPRAVNVDWVSLRRRQHDRAVDDVKAELLLDRIADAEKIEATDEDVEKEISALAERSGESATALRARLTKQGALDRMKSKLRSDKTIEWLYRNTRIETTAKREA